MVAGSKQAHLLARKKRLHPHREVTKTGLSHTPTNSYLSTIESAGGSIVVNIYHKKISAKQSISVSQGRSRLTSLLHIQLFTVEYG